MMGALDEKYQMAVDALRREARRRRVPFKELIVRIASDSGFLNIPLWNDDVDADLTRRSKGRAS